jgi:hypothetical protein
MEHTGECELSFQKTYRAGAGFKVSFTEFIAKEKFYEQQVYRNPAMAKYRFRHEGK